MVNLQSSPLDRTFAALADPTRRALVMRLAEAPDISVSALAAPFPVSLPAIMKHLDVLSDAGLIARRKTGRSVVTWAWHSMPERESLVTVEFKPHGDGTMLTLRHEQLFDEATRDRHQHGWNGALDKLEKFVA
jgi:DNA-binding transcriptional ArsR family regulator